MLMRVDTDKIKNLCRRRKLTLDQLLKEAGVSRNAYYSLARRESVLPGSIVAIAHALDVSQSKLLTDEAVTARMVNRLLTTVDRILEQNPGIDRDTVRHTLLLLQEKPVERLRRALIRGRQLDIRTGRNRISA